MKNKTKRKDGILVEKLTIRKKVFIVLLIKVNIAFGDSRKSSRYYCGNDFTLFILIMSYLERKKFLRAYY
jgi:hypothetical protein